MASLSGEIERRKVFQGAAAFAVVAGLIVQVVATLRALERPAPTE